MTIMETILLTSWMGAPIFIWLGGILLLFCALNYGRGFRFEFKGKGRGVVFETNRPKTHRHAKASPTIQQDPKPKRLRRSRHHI